MNQEYAKRERLTLSGGGSSARLLREDELGPDMRRRKDAQVGDTDERYIQMLCDRYRDRGVASKVHADAARQRKQEALTRAMAPGAYILSEKLEDSDRMDKYRSGLKGGRRYMTVDDFDRYYHDQRGYRFPQYRAPSVTELRHDMAEPAEPAEAADMMTETPGAGEVIPPKKAGWLTDTDKSRALVQKLLRYKCFNKLNEWAGETFPRESRVVHDKRRARPIPVGLVAALVVVAVSMSLVISSTVLVSQSTREVSQLKESLEEKQEIIGDLSDRLDQKNDLLDIKDKAVNQLGMVGEQYLGGEYLENTAEDYLEVYGEDSRGNTSDKKEKSGWAALLSAFGIGSD